VPFGSRQARRARCRGRAAGGHEPRSTLTTEAPRGCDRNAELNLANFRAVRTTTSRRNRERKTAPPWPPSCAYQSIA
jgi:hypothetical protein